MSDSFSNEERRLSLEQAQSDSGERFTVLSSIGKGATGRVYEVQDSVTGGRFALKRFRHDRAVTPERLARFKDEFRSLQRISHRNLVKVYELLADDTGASVLMELVTGVTLLQYVRIRPNGSREPGLQTVAAQVTGSTEGARAASSIGGALSVERLRAVLPQLVDGLLALHAHGKVHCDIKPENILVTNEGRVVILDFGLLTERTHEGGAGRGTLSWMAPEQFDGTFTEAVDWYAVGALLYAALAGRLPDTGNAVHAVGYARHFTRPVDPRLLVSGLPDDLAELALQLLHQIPEERPKGAEIARRVGLQLPSDVRAPAPLIVGRDRELLQLEEAFASARNRSGRLVYVHGESGIGKTALITRFSRALEKRGELVFSGSCYLDASVSYKGLDSVMDLIAARVARMDAGLLKGELEALATTFPVFRQSANPPPAIQDPVLMRRRAVAALRSVLTGLAGSRPVVVCIDDFQWSDPASIDMLADALHPSIPEGVLVVLAHRSLGSRVDECVEYARARLPPHDSIALGPLDEGAVRAIAAAAVGDAYSGSVNDLLRESQGNPFFVGELLRAHAAGDAREHLNLEQALSSRVNRLQQNQRAYLEFVSVAGQPIDERVLAGALGISRTATLEARFALGAASLIRTTGVHGQAVEPYHDRIRQYVSSSLAPEAGRLRHNSLAQAYEELGPSNPEVLGLHYRAAGNVPKALHYTERAGDAAVGALAFDHAADLYAAAVEMAPDEVRETLAIKYARALSDAGRPAEAAKAFETALTNQPESLELKFAVGDEFLRAGQIKEGLAVLREVASSVGEPIPRSKVAVRLSLLWHGLKLRFLRPRPFKEISEKDHRRLELSFTIGLRLALVDYSLGALFRLRCLHFARKVGSRTHMASGFAYAADFIGLVPAWLGGGVAKVKRCVDIAYSLVRPSDPLLTRAVLLHASHVGHMATGEWKTHRLGLEETLDLLSDPKEAVGLHWARAFIQSLVVVLMSMEGEVLELRNRVPRFKTESRGHLAVESFFALVGGVTLSLCDDDPLAARRLADDAIKPWPAESWLFQHHLNLIAQCEIDLYSGTPSKGLDRLSASWSRSLSEGYFQMTFFRGTALFLRVRLLLAAGRLREAERHIRGLERQPEEWTLAVGTALRGALLAQRGEISSAISTMQAAVRRLEGRHMALYEAAARFSLAELQGERNMRRAVLEQLEAQRVRNPVALLSSFLPLGPSASQNSFAFSTGRPEISRALSA